MAEIQIVPFRDDLAASFELLNREWIERLFKMEPTDLEMLRDPHVSILSKGGQIFFALDGTTPVGTVAAARESYRVFELAKMAVKPGYQGRGIGEQLGRAAIEYAHAQGATMIYLETNSTLQNAVRLYERLGFVHATRPHPSEYERSNVYMELHFRG